MTEKYEAISKPSEWRPMKDAPMDRPILLWGKLRGPGLTEMHPHGKMRVVGCWNEIDSAWTLLSTPWNGPFFDPMLWAEIPDVPCSQLERMLEEPDSEKQMKIAEHVMERDAEALEKLAKL